MELTVKPEYHSNTTTNSFEVQERIPAKEDKIFIHKCPDQMKNQVQSLSFNTRWVINPLRRVKSALKQGSL